MAPQLRHATARISMSDDERHPAHDVRYAGIENLPSTESLATTLERFAPYWQERNRTGPAEPAKMSLIAAHGNSLRALVKMLDGYIGR